MSEPKNGEEVSPEELRDLILLYLYASPRGETRSPLHLETALKHIIKAIKGERVDDRHMPLL